MDLFISSFEVLLLIFNQIYATVLKHFQPNTRCKCSDFWNKKVYISLYVSQLILLMLSSITNVLLCHCCIGKSVKLIAPHFHCLYLASFYTSVIVIETNVTFSVQFYKTRYNGDPITRQPNTRFIWITYFFLQNNELQVFYVCLVILRNIYKLFISFDHCFWMKLTITFLAIFFIVFTMSQFWEQLVRYTPKRRKRVKSCFKLRQILHQKFKIIAFLCSEK